MTPSTPIPKKNPQVRTRPPALPPVPRSRAALVFTSFAARGEFRLQQCAQCGTVIYPFRDVCPCCLSTDLKWTTADPLGELIAETVIHVSGNVYYRDRTPWRIGTVRLPRGVSVIAHLHASCVVGAPARLLARTDRSGRGVVFAAPEQDDVDMAKDPQWRELTCDPKDRRALVTDARAPGGAAIAKALLGAGAERVFLGVAEQWRGGDHIGELAANPRITIVPLDVSDTESVRQAAASIGAKVEILINTADHVRPDAGPGAKGLLEAQETMATTYFGLLRLIHAFAPVMKSRAADGRRNACAWVNVVSVYGLTPWPVYGAHSAGAAAALSATHSLRADMAQAGVKVMTAFTGPIDEDWRQELPAPKAAPAAIAKEIVAGLQQGLEEIAIGAVAKDITERWRENPDLLARELAELGVD